jgi:hypothetical protein
MGLFGLCPKLEGVKWTLPKYNLSWFLSMVHAEVLLLLTLEFFGPRLVNCAIYLINSSFLV